MDSNTKHDADRPRLRIPFFERGLEASRNRRFNGSCLRKFERCRKILHEKRHWSSRRRVTSGFFAASGEKENDFGSGLGSKFRPSTPLRVIPLHFIHFRMGAGVCFFQEPKIFQAPFLPGTVAWVEGLLFLFSVLLSTLESGGMVFLITCFSVLNFCIWVPTMILLMVSASTP